MLCVCGNPDRRYENPLENVPKLDPAVAIDLHYPRRGGEGAGTLTGHKSRERAVKPFTTMEFFLACMTYCGTAGSETSSAALVTKLLALAPEGPGQGNSTRGLPGRATNRQTSRVGAVVRYAWRLARGAHAGDLPYRYRVRDCKMHKERSTCGSTRSGNSRPSRSFHRDKRWS